jgi:dihydroorotate dehydrogenase electron transfer subunit
MFQENVEILSNQVIAPGYYKMIVSSPRIAKKMEPGQFLHVRCSENYSPLLRRPFSIHARLDNSSFALLYKVVGRGTETLSRCRSRDRLDVLGPLGRGFRISSNKGRVLIVAGGIGVAPFLFLAQTFKETGVEATLLLGAGTKDALLSVSDFKELGIKVLIATEDGTAGKKGYVSDIFEESLLAQNKPVTTVYACGPREMLKRVAVISGIYGIPCQVSLEEAMACGVGACLSCVVLTNSGYKKVCSDGPVFDGGEMVWPT